MKPPEIKDARLINAIADELFPEQQEDIRAFTKAELGIAIRSLKSGKALGPDGIPVEVLKAIASRSPETLLDVYNVFLREGVFSSRWKKANLRSGDLG